MGELVGTKLWKASGGSYYFECPGCQRPHGFWTAEYYGGDTSKHPAWSWNGDGDKPTVTPSINCDASRPERHCHFFITNGQIAYQMDCWHNLKGQTVNLPDWGQD